MLIDTLCQISIHLNASVEQRWTDDVEQRVGTGVSRRSCKKSDASEDNLDERPGVYFNIRRLCRTGDLEILLFFSLILTRYILPILYNLYSFEQAHV